MTGGLDENRPVANYLDSTEIYFAHVGSWIVDRTKLPRPMYGLRAAYIEDKVLIFGEVMIITAQ